MSIAHKPLQIDFEVPGLTRPMTYEEYRASPEENHRYDIIDGWKIYRTYGDQSLINPHRRHQEIQGNIYVALWAFAKANGGYRAVLAPCDILFGTDPSKIRQPDVLLTSEVRLSQNASSTDQAPLRIAPELIVEIISPSETESSLATKLRDYKGAGVFRSLGNPFRRLDGHGHGYANRHTCSHV